MAEGNLLELIKALYGLPTSGNMWHAKLLHTSREMGIRPTDFDPNVWIRGIKGGYDYIGTQTDDVLVVDVNPTSIFNNLKETYTIKTLVPKKAHLGCDYSQVKKGATTWWFMGISTYTAESLRNVYALLKVETLRKDKLPISPGDHPELDLSPLLGKEKHCLYHQLVGMKEWMAQIRRFEIRFEVT